MVKLRDLVILITCSFAGLVGTGSKDAVYPTNINAKKESYSNLKVLETMVEAQHVESNAYGADDHNFASFDSENSSQKNTTHPLNAQKHNVSNDRVIDESY